MTVMVDAERERKPHGDFRHTDHQREDGQKLPFERIDRQEAIEGDEIEIRRVQHQLDAHEHDDEVS